jgi:uncharacterized protein YbjT (DUF2867 family)
LQGIDTVVSLVQGGPETIIDGQKNLLMAAKQAGVKRFVPSDYSMDLFKVKDEIFNNTLRRRFSEEILYPSGVGYTNVLMGMFMDMGVIGFVGLVDPATKEVKIWGTGNEKLNWTTLEDSARYTVEAIHDPSAHNQVVKVSGDTRTLNEFAKYVAEASGSAYKTTFLGSFEDLAATVAKTFQEQPQNFYAWMPLQYAWGFVSEKFVLNPLWNNKYPNVKPTTLEEWVKAQKW